jgi:hypothetical protein
MSSFHITSHSHPSSHRSIALSHRHFCASPKRNTKNYANSQPPHLRPRARCLGAGRTYRNRRRNQARNSLQPRMLQYIHTPYGRHPRVHQLGAAVFVISRRRRQPVRCRAVFRLPVLPPLTARGRSSSDISLQRRSKENCRYWRDCQLHGVSVSNSQHYYSILCCGTA